MNWLRKLFEGDFDAPKGTIAMMVIFVILIIALWGNAYLQVTLRGTTQ